MILLECEGAVLLISTFLQAKNRALISPTISLLLSLAVEGGNLFSYFSIKTI